MLVFKTEVLVEGINGEEITDFMLNCTDEKYQTWWKGTHFRFHTIKQFPDDIEFRCAQQSSCPTWWQIPLS